jgi:hypothetical protein
MGCTEMRSQKREMGLPVARDGRTDSKVAGELMVGSLGKGWVVLGNVQESCIGKKGVLYKAILWQWSGSCKALRRAVRVLEGRHAIWQ